MAKAGNDPAGTSGSQFFIVVSATAPRTSCHPDYALVGEVVDGMDVVDEIARTATSPTVSAGGVGVHRARDDRRE